MRSKLAKIALAAGIMLAITLTLSCSDSGNDESGGSSPSVGEGSSSSEGTQGTVSSSSDGGSSSSAMTISSSSDGGQAESKIVKSKISGVSQKGPFVKGSTASLYELDGSFSQTGRSFRDIIADDHGKFEIKNVELVSPYAMLEADGFYRNEVTGKISAAPIKLYAIADIREKDNVNVNLLTHLEYYRVLNLVENGKTVAEAKKQAQKEILAVFGINGEFENSEDMTIFGTTEGDAALLAISILLQGDLGEGEFSQRLTDFAQSIKENGAWDNEAEKNKIANWASGANLARIRSNILAWGLSSEVPGFEKYVTEYWTEVYGIGGCGVSNQGEIKKDNRDAYRICKSGNWAVATEFESDTYQWVCSVSNEGEIKAGNVSETDYICKNKAWRAATYFERDTYQWVCSDANAGEIKNGNVTSIDYICENKAWREATNVESDVQSLCIESNEGAMKIGKSSKEYVCKYGVWQEPSFKDKFCSENRCEYFVDSRDNQRYYYVVIGNQTWMAENLNYETDSCDLCNYHGIYRNRYGIGYDWATAMDLPSACNSSSACSSQMQPKHRGICPDGWHIPSKAEWDELVTLAGGQSVAGTKLKATDECVFPEDNGTDNYGFSALSGRYDGSTSLGYWWAQDSNGDDIVYKVGCNQKSIYRYVGGYNKYFPASIRCLKD